MTTLPNISQSLIKQVQAYKAQKHCGLLLKAEWFDNVRFEPTKAMRLGQWFEYKATGQLNYYGEIPVPDTKKDGSLTVEFLRAEQQAENFKAYMEEWGWEIRGCGLKVVDDELGMSMTLDIDLYIPEGAMWPFSKTAVKAWQTWSPELAHVNTDLKYSGLIGNSYHPLGWSLDSLPDSDHMLQPVQYSIVNGRNAFLFLVFGTTPAADAEIFPVVVTEGAKDDHMELVAETRTLLKSAARSGFSAHPSFKNCKACPLREGCKYRVTAPEPLPVTVAEAKL